MGTARSNRLAKSIKWVHDSFIGSHYPWDCRLRDKSAPISTVVGVSILKTPEELHEEARRLVALSKLATDQMLKERYAAQAVEIVQLAQKLSRKD